MTAKKQEAQVQAMFRVPPAFLRRVEKVAKRMSSAAGFRVTRTEVLRAAALKGLEQLEKAGNGKGES